jgi:anti-anti-sigma regulatory factor
MTSKGPVVIKEFPQSRNFARRKSFLSEVRNLARRTYRPQLVLDIPESAEMAPDAIELLLECVEQVEQADGRVSVVAGSPQTAVILEITRLASVLDIFSSVSEAVNGGTLHRYQHDGLVQPIAA